MHMRYIETSRNILVIFRTGLDKMVHTRLALKTFNLYVHSIHVVYINMLWFYMNFIWESYLPTDQEYQQMS